MNDPYSSFTAKVEGGYGLTYSGYHGYVVEFRFGERENSMDTIAKAIGWIFIAIIGVASAVFLIFTILLGFISWTVFIENKILAEWISFASSINMAIWCVFGYIISHSNSKDDKETGGDDVREDR
jgi:uncharacterized protein YqhQ